MTDQYIGIDLHKAFFQACAVSPSGERLWEGRFPRTTEGLASLTGRCTVQTALAVEASTPTWHFADAVRATVGDLRIVDPLRTKLKAGYAAKTDRLDARLEDLALAARAAASVRTLRRVLAVIRAEAAAMEAEVRRLSADDPIAEALQQLRGIGPVLALTIRAELGEIGRFPTGAHVASYAGLVPRVEASAGRVRYGAITRRGSPWLRWALIEAAIHGTTRTDRVGRWGRRLAIRKGALKARVALARVLCEEIHRHWSRIA